MEEMREKFEVLVFGHIDLIQRVLPSMRRRGRGLIINVTSLAAQLPIPLMAPYNAAKAAMSAFSASLGLELAGTGIQVVELQPGDIRTEFNASVFKGADHGYEALAQRAWAAVEHEIAVAPPPEIVARAVLRLIRWPRPLVIAGGFFQAVVAARAARLLPRSWLLWGIRKYFGI
jgi:short-subunit dehydrogenase